MDKYNMVKTEFESGIYILTNSINGKRYVGQSKNIKRRIREHIRSLRRGAHYNSYLQNSFDKYGEDQFVFSIIEECGIDALNDRESFWIKQFNSTDRLYGYNMMAVGSSVVHSVETRKKISNTRKERFKSGLITPTKFERTPEMRRQQGESMKKYFSNKEVRYKLSLLRSSSDLLTIKRIKVYLKNNIEATQEEVAEEFGVSVNIIRHIISGASHSLILSDLNEVIKNRDNILVERIDKKIMSMYRDAYSYTEIGKSVELHHRNVIRRINQMATDHDDRCRLNTFNYLNKRKVRTVITLLNMGNNTVEVSTKLGVSRNYIAKCKSGKVLAEVNNVNQMRGVINPFRKVVIE